MSRRKKVRVAIIGVGNCASSLVQGVHYYKDADKDAFVPGLMHVDLGGYHVSDIEFSAAFDVGKEKVGKDLGEAIFAHPNNTVKFADVPHLDVSVQRGMTHDGLGKYLSEVIEKAEPPTVDVAEILKATKTDVVVSYLPVGSEEATKWYVEQILQAGCGFINCIPVFIASAGYWPERFEKRGLPIIGDDIKSQVGATIAHRVLTRLFRERGVKLLRTYQLNFGGNTDFYKHAGALPARIKKDQQDQRRHLPTRPRPGRGQCPRGPFRPRPLAGRPEMVPHPPWKGRPLRRAPQPRTQTRSLGLAQLAGVVIDAVRCCKLALNHGLKGPLLAPSSYFMKTPPQQFSDDQAREMVEDFILQYGRNGRA